MRVSLVLPVFNEEEVLPITIEKLRAVLAGVDCDYEILFVDDGSRDGTLKVLEQESRRDHRIKVLSFSRNFGHQAAVTAGLDFASGDAMVIMDADLQDPPELIPEMIRLYEEGYDVVSPQRTARAGDTWFKRTTAALFYRTMRRMVDERMPEEVGDFRLLSRAAADAIRQFREQHRFMRGMVAWLGLKEAFIRFERQPRAAGVSKYPLWKMIKLSGTAVTSFSAMPLRFTMGLGFSACLLAFAYLVYAVMVAFFYEKVVWGWPSIVFIQCFFFGLTLICVGLIGEYVARIYEETKGRPLYVVGALLNLQQNPEIPRTVVVKPRMMPATKAGRL